MTIYIDNHPCHYEVQALCMLFLHGEPVTVEKELPDLFPARYIYTGLRPADGGWTASVRVAHEGREKQRAERLGELAEGREGELLLERVFGRLLFALLEETTGVRPAWGILTGVRPVKLVRGLLDAGKTAEEIERYLTDEMLVSGEKAALALETAQVQRPILKRQSPRRVALYVSIPFCPSRCRYCSFVSHSIAQAGKLVEPYLELLEQELAALGARVRQYGLRLSSVYFGGGTPTVLQPEQLRRVTKAVKDHFDLNGLEEYTVEAGRPDTITAEKLAVLLEAGARRISINPQSLQDEVLRRAGRLHTARDVVDKFNLARAAGFPVINMDLIAGLEGDTPEGFRDTLERVLALRPDNVTVHTLSVKRSAQLAQDGGEVLAHGGAGGMVSLSQGLLHAAGYRPFYLYRQKNTVDNLENTGWSLPGQESPYNICIMDESQTILAAGAGAVTKLVDGEKITRIFNYKYPYEYISRFETLRGRHAGIDAFYRGGDR